MSYDIRTGDDTPTQKHWVAATGTVNSGIADPVKLLNLGIRNFNIYFSENSAKYVNTAFRILNPAFDTVSHAMVTKELCNIKTDEDEAVVSSFSPRLAGAPIQLGD